ncbi:hypothetical protein TNCV_1691761 [Trichonephila clavipes]|nr:hypothetical protein TNCV_1691761 [Trichonephila clavipes]
MAAVDFLHQENPSAWVEPATLGIEGQRQTNYATQPAKPEETGGRQREKSLDTRHRRLDDRYRVLPWPEERWWSVCTTPCTVCTFNALRRSVVPARVSSHSSHHCWKSPLPHASALIQRDFGCVLGVQQTKQLPHVAKVDLVWQLGV